MAHRWLGTSLAFALAALASCGGRTMDDDVYAPARGTGGSGGIGGHGGVGGRGSGGYGGLLGPPGSGGTAGRTGGGGYAGVAGGTAGWAGTAIGAGGINMGGFGGSGGVDKPVPPDQGAPPVTNVSPGQKYLFEVGASSSARTPARSGYYVTADGTVWRYDGTYGADAGMTDAAGPDPATADSGVRDGSDAGSPLPASANPSEAQLSAVYRNASAVAHVAPATLTAKYALVGAARRGALLSQQACMDAGLKAYKAWTYNEKTGRYTAVVLAQNGDAAVENATAEAAALVQWLDGLLGESTTCVFIRARCDPGPCAAPVCPAGLVPVRYDVKACANGCGEPSQCGSVSGCTLCRQAGLPCVVDGTGDAHCASLDSVCRNAGISAPQYTCDCSGDALCAAGKSACRGSMESGFWCEAP